MMRPQRQGSERMADKKTDQEIQQAIGAAVSRVERENYMLLRLCLLLQEGIEILQDPQDLSVEEIKYLSSRMKEVAQSALNAPSAVDLFPPEVKKFMDLTPPPRQEKTNV
jgi:hypothetical protein